MKTVLLEILRSPTGEFVVGFAGVLILTVIGAYFVLKVRDSIGSDDSSADLLSKFQEMRHEGHINEEEFRTIKTDLGGQLSPQSWAEPKQPSKEQSNEKG